MTGSPSPSLRRHAKFAGMGRPALAAVPARELARYSGSGSWPGCSSPPAAQGWLLLFDEVELIGRYTLLQRGRSYAELARWLQPDADDPGVAAGRLCWP